jgi:hypothetical protein
MGWAAQVTTDGERCRPARPSGDGSLAAALVQAGTPAAMVAAAHEAVRVRDAGALMQACRAGGSDEVKAALVQAGAPRGCQIEVMGDSATVLRGRSAVRAAARLPACPADARCPTSRQSHLQLGERLERLRVELVV